MLRATRVLVKECLDVTKDGKWMKVLAGELDIQLYKRTSSLVNLRYFEGSSIEPPKCLSNSEEGNPAIEHREKTHHGWF